MEILSIILGVFLIISIYSLYYILKTVNNDNSIKQKLKITFSVWLIFNIFLIGIILGFYFITLGFIKIIGG